jgi:hypothetical protein
MHMLHAVSWITFSITSNLGAKIMFVILAGEHVKSMLDQVREGCGQMHACNMRGNIIYNLQSTLAS